MICRTSCVRMGDTSALLITEVNRQVRTVPRHGLWFVLYQHARIRPLWLTKRTVCRLPHVYSRSWSHFGVFPSILSVAFATHTLDYCNNVDVFGGRPRQFSGLSDYSQLFLLPTGRTFFSIDMTLWGVTVFCLFRCSTFGHISNPSKFSF